ncbi:hypothetical protein PIB30_093436 [Stylosanthes scabra]|uniref:Uncharacterized protein n=1 Tax=Stylosanthes scabra TaxID=79078 RepID=A0ABU6YSQ6_9FABA|nr:hypothetical protein [Stylosanthes scabra]
MKAFVNDFIIDTIHMNFPLHWQIQINLNTKGGMDGITGATRAEFEDPPKEMDVGFALDPPELAMTSSNFAYSSVVLNSGNFSISGILPPSWRRSQ